MGGDMESRSTFALFIGVIGTVLMLILYYVFNKLHVPAPRNVRLIISLPIIISMLVIPLYISKRMNDKEKNDKENNGICADNNNSVQEYLTESPACFLQVDGVSIPLNLSVESLGPAEHKKVTLFLCAENEKEVKRNG